MAGPAPVEHVLRPRSVAIVGASEDKAKYGGRVTHYLLHHDFPGQVYLVNPRRAEILGHAAYPDMAALPGPVDVAFLAVPPGVLVETARACAAAGTGCIVVLTTGFAETGEAEGAARQAELLAALAGTGTRLLGPNCFGLIVPPSKLALSTSVILDAKPLLEGPVALVSQSGALMVAMIDRARVSGIGFRACVSVGNQADLELCDFVEHLIDDPATRAICVYAEGFRDGARFLAAAERCRAAGKPLLLTKVGRTEAGVRAAMSHTASLAGSYAALAAACEARGAVLCDDPDVMVVAADALARFGVPPAGDIVVISPSGGGAGVAVDRIEEAGLPLAALSEATRTALGAVMLPPQADNPLDLGGRRAGESLEATREAARLLAGDPAVGVVLAAWTTTPFYAEATRAVAEEVLARGRAAVFAVLPGAAADGPRAELRALGVPICETLDDAIRTAAALLAAGRLARAEPGLADRPADCPWPEALPPAGILTEPEAKALLAAYGVAATREALAGTPEEAVAAAARIGYPVALKVVSREIVHKSEAGGVALGLAGPGALAAAWEKMAARVAHAAPGAAIEGFLVQEMRRGGTELLIGARRDPQFGPIVVFGAGGTLVEMLRDVSVAAAPLGPEAAERLVRASRVWPLLAGWRGAPPADLAAIVDALCRVGWLAHDLGERLVELEANPLLAGPDGAVVLDARGRIEG